MQERGRASALSFFCAKSDKVKEPSIPGGSFGERIFVLWNMKQKDNT
jgi:hypothetical protein